jgi:5-methyltetrahydrofolate--homocysteine methyltransferase
VNLGIKVPPEALIQAVREHRPDVVGLSGLLVKSAQQMVATASDLKAAGVELPLLVGGAALSRNFVDRQIAPAYGGTVAYAQDAMSGLDLAKRVTQTDKHEFLRKELQERRTQLAAVDSARPAPVRPSAARRSRKVAPLKEVPRPPDLDRHALTNTPLDHIWRFINPVMIYGRHMGLKSSVVKDVEAGNRAELEKSEAGRKALQLKAALDDLKAECRAGAMQARAVYQFFRARGEGDDLVLLDPRGAELFRFTFPRQEGADGLCLSDYVGADDAVALFLTTAGAGIRARAEAYKKNGDFLKSHLLQALALETAEGYAELLHANLRSQWGFPDPLEMTMIDRFKASYHGKRYSFGYPACPRLEDQQILFRALRPEEIGVELTDGCMMDPEASVSAVVFHHPDATYFSVAGGTGC